MTRPFFTPRFLFPRHAAKAAVVPSKPPSWLCRASCRPAFGHDAPDRRLGRQRRKVRRRRRRRCGGVADRDSPVRASERRGCIGGPEILQVNAEQVRPGSRRPETAPRVAERSSGRELSDAESRLNPILHLGGRRRARGQASLVVREKRHCVVLDTRRCRNSAVRDGDGLVDLAVAGAWTLTEGAALAVATSEASIAEARATTAVKWRVLPLIGNEAGIR